MMIKLRKQDSIKKMDGQYEMMVSRLLFVVAHSAADAGDFEWNLTSSYDDIYIYTSLIESATSKQPTAGRPFSLIIPSIMHTVHKKRSSVVHNFGSIDSE